MAASGSFDHVGGFDSRFDYTVNTEKSTVDQGYFNTTTHRSGYLLSDATRLSQLSANPGGKGRTHDLDNAIDHASITIAKTEYNNLLRTARDYEALRKALILGGVDSSTLDVLVAHSNSNNDARKDSALADDHQMFPKKQHHPEALQDIRAPISAPTHPSDQAVWRHVNYEMTPSDDDSIEHRVINGSPKEKTTGRGSFTGPSAHSSFRTLFFTGLSTRTTYKDLFSVLKGGKVISAVLRHDSAIVCFADGAADFLAWSKRNDVYLQGKRIEVRWAEHEYRYSSHISDKVAGGATRNLMIHHAMRGGLSESRIREDMEHINNLVIIDVKFTGGHAYVYTNAINYALFARTCMMSRAEYKGRKIEFFRDECDVPLPLRENKSSISYTHSAPKKAQKPSISNRFGVLNMDGTEAGSDEDVENRDPDEAFSDDDSMSGFYSGFGARLNFQDSDE